MLMKAYMHMCMCARLQNFTHAEDICSVWDTHGKVYSLIYLSLNEITVFSLSP
jgi:hypothetical protein